MQYSIRKWNQNIEDMKAIIHVYKKTYPQLPVYEPKEFLVMLSKRMEGFEDGLSVAECDDTIIGFANLFPEENPTKIRLLGGVSPMFQRHGVGSALLQHSIALSQKRGYTEMQSMSFTSNPNGETFLKSAGFVDRDRIFWNRRDCNMPPPLWARQKYESVIAAGIRIMTGTEFEQLRPDWDRCWWEHVMESLKDIPSDTPFEVMPFEKWKSYLEKPFCDRSRAFIAVDRTSIAGILQLSIPVDREININHTSVNRAYRRRGISTALKFAAIQSLQTEDLHWLRTQNHQRNPMHLLNQSFGFTNIDTQIEWAKEL
ncbi:MAG: GNAT family N-acetyltransferase [Myxococcota bacterium]|nr:GNAT family N-acetyltransferase [Myxococcota bacterium]